MIPVDFKNEYLDFSTNMKFIGKFGDQIGIKKGTIIQIDNDYKWKEKLENKKWRKFFLGYMNYLYENTNNWDIDKGTKTFAFNYFKIAGNYIHEINLIKKKLRIS